MDDSEQTMRIKLINHLTGEVSEMDINNLEQAKNAYLELSASESVIKKAKVKLANFIDSGMGQDDRHDFIDGHYVRRVQRTQLVYRIDVVKKYLKEVLDKDTYNAVMETITKIDQVATNAMLVEMQDRNEIPHDTLKHIREEADQKSTKPYVEVR